MKVTKKFNILSTKNLHISEVNRREDRALLCPSVRLTADVFAGLPTVVKLVDKETLLREREEKKKVSGDSA